MVKSRQDLPIGFVQRPGLSVVKADYRGTLTWIFKDPISLKFHRLGAAEKIVWDMLDGETTFRQVRAKLSSEYPTMKVEMESIFGLIRNFHEQAIVESLKQESFCDIIRRREKQQRQEWKRTMFSILWLRLPGIDPEWILNRVYPRCRFLFSQLFFYSFLVAMLGMLCIICSNLDEFFSRIPQLDQFSSANGLIWIPVVLLVTKTIHEFGHALCCKHFGGECHEIGFMLLFFNPTMYCDASDSWTFPNKWHRIAVAAAGIYFELLIVILAFAAWWFTPPGFANYLLFLVLLLSGGLSVFFNLNPLMRFDGYYMLSDIIEIPNLQSRAQQVFWSKFRNYALAIPPTKWEQRQFEKSGWVLVAFYLAALAYRTIVISGILLLVIKTLPRYGLTGVSYLLAGVIFLGLLGQPAFRTLTYFSDSPTISRRINWSRFAVWMMAGVLSISLLFYPFQRKIRTLAVLDLMAPSTAVYVPTSGRLLGVSVSPGEQVSVGAVIAKLANNDLLLHKTQLTGDLKVAQRKLVSLEASRGYSPHSRNAIPGVTDQVQDLHKQLDAVTSQFEGLVLKAARAGTIYPSSMETWGVSDLDETLDNWTGRPTDKENRGAFLEAGTEFCRIADREELAVIIMVKERQLSLLRNGLCVALVLDEIPTRLPGVISDISTKPLRSVPPPLRATRGGQIPCQPNNPAQPIEVMYEVTAMLDAESMVIPLIPGMRGTAIVTVERASFYQRFVEKASQLLMNVH